MNDQPLAIRDATPEAMRAHYRYLIDRLTLVRAQYDGVLGPKGQRLVAKSQLAARVALTALQEGR